MSVWRSFGTVLCGLSAMLLSLASAAQTVPGAGTLQQQIERDRQPQLPQGLTPTRPAQPPAMKAPAGQSVTVKEFRYAGNTLLSSAQLDAAVARFLNRPIAFGELQEAAAAITQVYRDKGWVVRAYLPSQDIQDGVVTIQIVEAVFGETRVEQFKSERIRQAQIMALIAQQQPKGKPLNSFAIDRGLLLADDVPGVAVSGALQAGQSPGETDLVIKFDDKPLLVGEANVDNTGSRATGSERLTLDANLASPLKIGDRFGASFIHTQGSEYLRLTYSLPVGNDGWRIGANTSQLGYRLVTSDFSGLDAKGSSGSTGVEAVYPIIRSRLRNLYFNANYDWKNFDNQAGGTTSSRYKADALTLALNGNLFDNLGGGGANAASISYVEGNLDLSDSPNQAADAATTQTNGRYSKLRWSLSRQQVITNELSFFGQYANQSASKNLDSSEKFYLGGANGIRAYPASEGGGSEGQMLNLELRYKLPQGLILTAFYDWGQVTVNRNKAFAGASDPNDFSLKGYGLSLGWATPAGVNLKMVWAQRDGDNPNPTATGNDQDGSLVRDRFWLTAALPF